MQKAGIAPEEADTGGNQPDRVTQRPAVGAWPWDDVSGCADCDGPQACLLQSGEHLIPESGRQGTARPSARGVHCHGTVLPCAMDIIGEEQFLTTIVPRAIVAECCQHVGIDDMEVRPSLVGKIEIDQLAVAQSEQALPSFSARRARPCARTDRARHVRVTLEHLRMCRFDKDFHLRVLRPQPTNDWCGQYRVTHRVRAAHDDLFEAQCCAPRCFESLRRAARSVSQRDVKADARARQS